MPFFTVNLRSVRILQMKLEAEDIDDATDIAENIEWDVEHGWEVVESDEYIDEVIPDTPAEDLGYDEEDEEVIRLNLTEDGPTDDEGNILGTPPDRKDIFD